MWKLLLLINEGFIHHAFWFCANMFMAFYFSILFGTEKILIYGGMFVIAYNIALIKDWWLKSKG